MATKTQALEDKVKSTRRAKNETKAIIDNLDTQEKEKEKKSQSVTFLLRPTTYQEVKTLVMLHDTTVNDLVNEFLDNYVEENRELLEGYRKFRASIK